MNKPIYAFLVLCTSGFLALTGISNAQILLNGSFELLRAPLPADSSVTGGGSYWTASSRMVDVNSNDYNGFGNTSYGSQYLMLWGGTSDHQTVSGFTLGQTYYLTADFADLNYATNETFSLSLSGGATGSLVSSVTSGGFYGDDNIPFQTATIAFTPTTSQSVTVTLGESLGSGFLAVDNVSISSSLPTGTLSSAPEPTVSALLVGGLVTLWYITRRNRRNA